MQDDKTASEINSERKVPYNYIGDRPFRERYMNDPLIHRFVTALVIELEKSELTTSDLAKCAVLASQIYAERNTGPYMIEMVDRRR